MLKFSWLFSIKSYPSYCRKSVLVASVDRYILHTNLACLCAQESQEEEAEEGQEEIVVEGFFFVSASNLICARLILCCFISIFF